MMKRHILYIIATVGALCMTGCHDETFDLKEGKRSAAGDKVYTLRIGIDPGTMSRSEGALVELPPFKTHWCYGDKVTLTSEDGNGNYTFTIPTPNGKTTGAPVTDTYATFTHEGEIPGIDNFSGTLEYVAGNANKKESIGIFASNYYVNDYRYDPITTNPMNCYTYAVQKSNDATANQNTAHLNNYDKLTATLTNVDLTASNVITLSRGFSIVKIVLDDFYYPIYGGSLLFVKGLNKAPGSKDVQAMVLGENIYDNTVTTGKQLYTDPDYLTTHHISPFCDVSSDPRPVTGYAKRDADHKIVAYMVFEGDRVVSDGERIVVALRDSWSLDWYFWQSMPMKKFTLHAGSFYTLDFTRNYAGVYEYESYAAINIYFQLTSSSISWIAPKNIGAKSVTDPGEYHMFGREDPIYPGGYFPYGPSHKTPYYYYCEDDHGKPCFGYNGVSGKDGTDDIHIQFPVVNPSTWGTTAIGKQEAHEISFSASGTGRHPKDWWGIWVKELGDMPSLYSSWAPLSGTQNNQTKRFQELMQELIGPDGQPTTDVTKALGLKLYANRTGHVVFLPITGMLWPYLPATETTEAIAPAVNSQHQIEAEATAEFMPGTEKQIALLSYWIYRTPATEPRGFKLTTLNCDLQNGWINYMQYNELYIAVPVRPAMAENKDLFKNIVETSLPGAL